VQDDPPVSHSDRRGDDCGAGMGAVIPSPALRPSGQIWAQPVHFDRGQGRSAAVPSQCSNCGSASVRKIGKIAIGNSVIPLALL